MGQLVVDPNADAVRILSIYDQANGGTGRDDESSPCVFGGTCGIVERCMEWSCEAS